MNCNVELSQDYQNPTHLKTILLSVYDFCRYNKELSLEAVATVSKGGFLTLSYDIINDVQTSDGLSEMLNNVHLFIPNGTQFIFNEASNEVTIYGNIKIATNFEGGKPQQTTTYEPSGAIVSYYNPNEGLNFFSIYKAVTGLTPPLQN